MCQTEILSIVALVISTLSLGISAYVALRDRGKIKATSKFYPTSEYGKAKLAIAIVNVGRRPVNLRLLGGNDKTGSSSGQFIGENKKDFFLSEHGRYDITLNVEDLNGISGPEVIYLEDLWVEDSLGRRHIVKNSKENIAKLRASK